MLDRNGTKRSYNKQSRLTKCAQEQASCGHRATNRGLNDLILFNYMLRRHRGCETAIARSRLRELAMKLAELSPALPLKQAGYNSPSIAGRVGQRSLPEENGIDLLDPGNVPWIAN